MPTAPQSVPILAYLEEPEDADRFQIEQCLSAAMAQMSWPAEPEVVDEVEDADDLAPGDEPTRTVGILIEVTAANRPGVGPTREQDRLELQSFQRLLDFVVAHSKATGKTWVFAYDGRDIGEVNRGSPDRGIVEGLLNPWIRATR